MENLSYYKIFLQERDALTAWIVLFLRSTAFGFGHGVYTGIVGFWLGYIKAIKGAINLKVLIAGLIPAVFLHALWNISVELLLIPLVLALVVLEIWLIKKITKEAQRDEVIWGYPAGLAPVE